jgi:hypothetical protein
MQKRGRRCSTQRVNYSSCVKKDMKNNHDAFAPGPDRSLGCRAWDTRTCQVKRMQVAATRTHRTRARRARNHRRPQRTREYNTYISHYKTSNGRHRHSWAAPGISMRGSFYADSPARLTRTQRDPDNAHTTRTPVHPIPASTKPNRGTCSSAMSIPSALVMPARCCAPSTRPPRVA